MDNEKLLVMLIPSIFTNFPQKNIPLLICNNHLICLSVINTVKEYLRDIHLTTSKIHLSFRFIPYLCLKTK